MAKKKPDPSLVVQAKDCYDPADYIMIHKDHYAKLLERVAPERWPTIPQKGQCGACGGYHGHEMQCPSLSPTCTSFAVKEPK